MTYDNPNNDSRNESHWDFGESDRRLAKYQSGEDVYLLVVGVHDYYGRGIFSLREKGTGWVLEEILGRPQEVLGLKV